MNLFKTLTRRKPLLWIGSLIGVLLLLITSLAIFVGTRSDDWWRNQITTRLSQTLEREVAIQGDFRLDLGRTVTIEVASISIRNPDWTETRDMLRLGSLRLEFDLLSVLGDTLLIHRLELTDIELALEENNEGKKNWEFVTESAPQPTRKLRKGITLPVHIEQLSLQRAQLSLLQYRWEGPLKLQIDALTGGQTSDDNAILDGSGQLGDLPLSLKGSLGKLSSALNQGPVSYQLSGKLGEAGLYSEGSIASLAPPLRPQLDLFLSGPEIMQITQAMGAPKIAEGPFEAHLNMVPGRRGISSRIQGQFGQLQLYADISAEDLTAFENMDVTARLSGENLAAFANLLKLPPLPKGFFEVDTVLHSDNGHTRIEKMAANVGKHRMSIEGVLGVWPELKDTRLKLDARGPDLAVFTPTVALIGLGQLPEGAYTVNALIESGENGLQVRPSNLTAGGYEVTAEGQIFTKVKKDRFRAELNITGSGPDLSMITRLVNTIQFPAWPFQAKGKIDITGKDITIIGASGTAGKHTVAVDGPIAFSSTGPLQLDVKGSGPSLQAVLQGLGYDVIPASAAYQVEGKVELANNRLVVTANHARLGPAEASATLSIPDLKTPTTLIVDVRELKTTDFATVQALVGMKLDLPQAMPANISGQIRRTKDTTGLSRVRGTIGTTTLKIDGTIGDPSKDSRTRLSLDISGSNFEHFLSHPVDQALPFQIKGRMERDKRHARFENLQLKLANINARVDGNVGSWERIAGSELTISAQGPNADAIAAILNRPLPAGTVKFDGHIRAVKDAFHIDRMNAQLGNSNLSGDLKLMQGKPPKLKGQMNSTYLDFALFQEKVKSEQTPKTKAKDTRITGLEDADDETPQQDTPPQKEQKLLFPDTPIKLEAFDPLDLDLKIRIDEVVNFWELGSLHGIKAGIQLNGRNLSVSDLEVGGIRGGKLKGNFAIGRDADLTSIDVDIKGEQLRFGLAATPRQAPETYPPVDIEAKFSGTGGTIRQLAASLDGRIKMVQGEGEINNTRMSILFSDVIYQLFTVINPFARTEPTTRLNCGVYISNLSNGNAELRAIVIQTDKLTILSTGNVDLNTERINVGFEIRPRTGLGISASVITNNLVRLRGTLSSPAVELDPGRATFATGAAVMTGGLSLLIKGARDRFFTSRDPCGEALSREEELRAGSMGPP